MYTVAKLFLCCLLYCIACNQPDIPKAVLTLTEQRMFLFRAEQDSICLAKARLKAELAVDSIFLSMTQRYLLDSIHIPEKPIKPMVDTNINLDNNTPVKPLWDTLK